MQNLEPIKKEITTLATQATSLKVTNETTKTQATSLLSQVNKYADSLKEKKETLTKPINLALKNIRTMFKPLETELDTLTANLRCQLSAYQTKQLAKEKAIADKMITGDLSVDQASKKLAKIDTAPSKTEEGTVTFVTVQKFEIIDAMMIFIKETYDHNKKHKDFIIDHEAFYKYFTPNEVAIRQAMKEGIEIPGVRYYEEQSVRNRR